MFGAKNNEHVMFLPNMWNVYSCLHFFQAIEISIQTLFPYYKYIFAQKIVCLHTFTIHVHNTKNKKKQCLSCWILDECTLLVNWIINPTAVSLSIKSRVSSLCVKKNLPFFVFTLLMFMFTALTGRGNAIQNEK